LKLLISGRDLKYLIDSKCVVHYYQKAYLATIYTTLSISEMINKKINNGI